MNNRFSSDEFLSRFGGAYPLVAIFISEIVALLGIIPGMLLVQANANLNQSQIRFLTQVLPLLYLFALLTLIAIGWLMTSAARKRLAELTQGIPPDSPDDEYRAWHEISGLTWRYGIAHGFVILSICILPMYFTALAQREVISSPFQANSIGSPDPVYLLLGGIVSLFVSAILALFTLEHITLPVRLTLLPKDFDTQLKGRAGTLLTSKFPILILSLILIGVLLIAPIGYAQAVRIIYSEVSSLEQFSDLQIESLLFSTLALLLGAVFSYQVARSVSNPIKDLIFAFQRVEGGDFSARAPISATDELGIVAIHFNRMVAQLEALQNTLEKQVNERTKQLSASNEVGRVAASSLDPDELLRRVIQLFPERFGYYFAAIYLIDPTDKWAELKEATGEAGQVLKHNHHRVEITGRSMVGAAVREKSTQITQVSTQDKSSLENPLLPYTRSEIALPLLAGDRVLGVLDVQSTREADFGNDVVETMQNMAGQVAIALENARLYQEAFKVIKEMRAVQQQYLQEGWSGYSSLHNEMEYGIGDESIETSRQMEVPINLRDQIIGQIVLEGNESWSSDEKSLVDAVATQAAIALENARLVNESRHVAIRERMLAEINSKIWASATIDGVLQTVAKELGRRMNASQVTVELNIDEED